MSEECGEEKYVGRLPFRYSDRGSMATIGRNRAVAEFGRWRLSGFAAWLLWLLVHVFLLIGFRNRLWVMREWVWAYFTRARRARLITGGMEPLARAPRQPAVGELEPEFARLMRERLEVEESDIGEEERRAAAEEIMKR